MAFTYFFRDSHTLELTVNNVIPYISGRSRVRIWDAGCAMGQEAYTLAMMFAENIGKFAFKNLHIVATDIDTCDLFEKIISHGIYPDLELKRISKNLFEKYFQAADKPGYHKLIDRIKNRVHYQKHDLLTFNSIGDGFSLIVCKNVLLHLQYADRIKVINMFHKSLAPGGFFVTEQTQKLPQETAHLFEQVTNEAQLYRKIG